MEKVRIENPTVGSLVAFLLTLDQSKPIIICDPDTGFNITIIHIDETNGKIEMTGYYFEMEW